MKYIFSNQVIDFAMLFLMIWNLWIFIDIGIINYSNKLLIMTSVIWGG